MAQEAIRFIHSGDWLLETPVGGVAEVPAELRESFVDAPYVAAERVVQAAIEQSVDFLLLTGDLLPLDEACPYSFEFLLGQFGRLAEHHIPVYWLGGQADAPLGWPEQLRLPENVHRFPADRLHQLDYRRNGKLMARLCGQSGRASTQGDAVDYAGGGDGVLRIAVVRGKMAKRSLENQGIDYWALGGEPRHQRVLQAHVTAVYAGSPQGRDPEDVDAHGAVLVELEPGGATTRLIETDVWRWRRELLEANESWSVDEVLAQLRLRLQAIPRPAEEQRHGWLLVWSIVCRGQIAWTLHQRAIHRRMLESLRAPSKDERRWTIDIEIEPSDVPAEWSEEDTVLGDFLRAVDRFREDPEAWRELAALLPEGPEREELQRELSTADEERRRRVWRCVAAWGADLLRGDVELDSVAAVSP